MISLQYYLITDTAKAPDKAHEEDACFDLYADLMNRKYKISRTQITSSFSLCEDCYEDLATGDLFLPHNAAAIIPTGISFAIPEGYRIDVKSRSGRAAKYRQFLTNGIGTIDETYVDEIFVLLTNSSGKSYTIKHHDKIAQFSLEKVLPVSLIQTSVPPASLKTSRGGGLGSTGDR